eukprot:TRINITY_DN23010_c0_g1_i1.p1 TRINITY_DN23010_c0_g1~~TRINITY_DN23010_c0_g1_i1.p1  ORF type:complete len:340 (-),score=43.97 TRINITY_DN23010_c0_g1_i1:88-1107(-)
MSKFDESFEVRQLRIATWTSLIFSFGFIVYYLGPSLNYLFIPYYPATSHTYVDSVTNITFHFLLHKPQDPEAAFHIHRQSANTGSLGLPSEHAHSRHGTSAAATLLPVVVHLHGPDLNPPASLKMLEQDPGTFPALAAGNADFPFVVITPQLPSRYTDWSAVDAASAVGRLVVHAVAGCDICSRAAVVLTGAGSAASAVFHVAAAAPPGVFAGAVPVAGAPPVDLLRSLLPRLRATEAIVWLFASRTDVVWAPALASDTAASLMRAQVPVRLTVYDDSPSPPRSPSEVGHGVWLRAYRERRFVGWLLEAALRGKINREHFVIRPSGLTEQVPSPSAAMS